jgi:hypothetical protein
MQAKQNDFLLTDLEVFAIDRKSAKLLCERHHYMKTYPNGAIWNFGIYYKKKIAGVCVFGYSSATLQKVTKIIALPLLAIIEMQRLWISDSCGHNSESYCLKKIIDYIKEQTTVKLIITHSGGCKNDCGIVYQSSSWLYFGKTPCKDFYLTAAGEYKNIVASMRFGRIKAEGRKPQAIGEALFGPGQIINSFRYTYVYPIDKGLRRLLSKKALAYEKTSEHFRRGQEWIT